MFAIVIKARMPIDLPTKASTAVEAFVGKSMGMRALMTMANKAAKASSTVLIIGETGTGKELVARHIHQTSERAGKPIISVNCAAIPETLIESELFGYEKGAFTGANAQRVGLIEAAASISPTRCAFAPVNAPFS